MLPYLASNPLTSQVFASVSSGTFVEHGLDKVGVVLLALLFDILKQRKGKEEHAISTLVKPPKNFAVTE